MASSSQVPPADISAPEPSDDELEPADEDDEPCPLPPAAVFGMPRTCGCVFGCLCACDCHKLPPRRMGRPPGVPLNRPMIRWSPAETRQQLLLIEEAMYSAGMCTYSFLATLCEKRLSRRPTVKRVQRLVKQVHAKWAAEDSDSRPHAKGAAIRRLHQHINQARREAGTPGQPGYIAPKWSAVARFEEILADIQGTRAPLRLNIEVNVTEALANAVASLTDDQIRERVERIKEMERLAEVGRKALTAGEGVIVRQTNGSNEHSSS